MLERLRDCTIASVTSKPKWEQVLHQPSWNWTLLLTYFGIILMAS